MSIEWSIPTTSNTHEVNIGDVHWEDLIVTQGAGTQDISLVNTASGVDRDMAERINISSTSVADIYRNTKISSQFKPILKSGRKLYLQLIETVKDEQTVEADSRLFPVPASLTITVSDDPRVDVADHALTTVRRLLALMEAASTTETSGYKNRLDAMLRGALVPKETGTNA